MAANPIFAETIENDQTQVEDDDFDFFQDEDLFEFDDDFEEDLEMSGYPEIFNVYIMDKKLADLDFFVKFTVKDLINGQIIISGEARTDIGTIEGIEITLDEGRSVQKAIGKTKWSFNFEPKDNQEYIFSARAADSTGSQSYFNDLNMIEIHYAKLSVKQELSIWFKKFRENYNAEKAKACHDLFSEEDFIGYETLEKELNNEFKKYNDLGIKFFLSNIKINEFEDEAIVSFAFKKERTGATYFGKSKALFKKDETKKGKLWKLAQLRGDRFAGIRE